MTDATNDAMPHAGTDEIRGPLRPHRNWAATAGAGSIHDDATAAKLGFRGGTVPGDVHMNAFAEVLLEAFGPAWLAHGNLSLDFRNATVDGEPVRAIVERPAPGQTQVRVRAERDDGLLVADGTAAIGDHGRSALRARDLRPVDPATLRILRRVQPGTSLGRYALEVSPARQFELYDQGLISGALPMWRTGRAGDGAIVACPSTLVQQMWGLPMRGLRPLVGSATGLFGAIEIGHVNGPLLLGRDCVFTSHVVSVGESPKTEFLWFDTDAHDPAGTHVASFRMMLRFMKASSPEWSAGPATA